MAGRNVDLYAGEDHAGYVISAAPTAGKTKYKTKTEEGTLAVIGPKRMEYDRVVQLLEFIKKNIES